jgi:hypothetical protein
MKKWLLVLGLGLVGGPALAVENEPSQENQAQSAQSQKDQIDPDAQAQLRRMSNYLSGLRTFRVDANAVDERVTTDGQKLQFIADTRVTVQRPNKLRADRLGAFADTITRYDGKNLSVFGKRTNFYATSPAPPTIDGMIDYARDRYGLDAPGADLLVDNPYALIMSDTTSLRDLGIEPINGIPCHHLAGRSANVDWQLWVEDGSRPLPHRYVVTTRDMPAKPEFAVTFSRWEPNAPVAASTFNFVPPPGAQRIKWMTLGPERAAR